MKKNLMFKILFIYFIFSKNLLAGDTEKIIQSNILGAVTSLVLPAHASVAISLLPYLRDNETKVSTNISNEDIFLKNNSSINYINSLNYIDSLAE